ncbi:phytoene synthase [Xaviernesmea oryzae]|uniref:Phytoene synthase n=1 Tax=Xaviernesmea oryzae TaxID=464029 RepID=A0A1Q9AX27_9HYPH|nr:phytoene/squalene synthase family protein [Xaviernesmea oryzae]OLP59986.1 phytoene synthase [Xaviernesmea oryzae]SEK41629.1 phytoene synthase [Xaviernesmea oryzae]
MSSTSAVQTSDAALEPSLASLRVNDRDRYLACLLAPEAARPALAALYAFHAEIARVRDVVREPLPGEIRLQWWRDVLDDPSGGKASGHPIAKALLETIATYRLPVSVLQDMIDARIFDLYDDPMEGRHALEGYAGETASALIQLAGLVLDPQAAAGAADAAGHAGVAQTVAGLLLLAPIHRSRGQVFFPLDLLAATGLDREGFLQGEDKAALGRAVDAMIGLGREHLAKARQAARGLAPSLRPAFVPVALAQPVFDRAAHVGAQLFEQPITPPQWRRQWRMWRAARSGRW